MKRIVLVSIVIGVVLGCASTFKLEPNDFINTTESYYTLWNSPVRGGGSGYSVYIVLNENLDLNANKIEIQGLYFKDKYCILKFQKLHLYQGFINNNNSIPEMEDASPSLHPLKEDDVEGLPFKLTGQAAVIVYKVKNLTKYVKIELRKKETLEVPM